jgi:hypothetical protein
LAIQGRDRDIQRRLWKAQNSVIFPYIEEMRVDWIEKNGRLLEPPFATFSGEVCDPADLEIGQLYFFLKPKWGVLSQADRASLLWMRDARHQLAHLETLPVSFIRKTGSPFSACGWTP